jgi:aminomethyltransferase
MVLLEDVHADHGATFTERGGRRVVRDYGRPARTHRAVRNAAGVIERPHGVVVVTGDDRVDFVDNAVSNRIPTADGEGTYALLLDPQGHVVTDMYAFTAQERLLVFTPPGRGDPLVEDWGEKTFIQDVDLRVASDDLAVFGVYGPKATEKVASVFTAQTPDAALTFDRGSMGDEGVTVIRDDGLVGEEGYLVVAAAADAQRVFDTLVNRGLNAVPFGQRTWETLTLEAGTPLFATELEGRLPNDVGLRNAVDFEKGCFVGQEVVSRVENRGTPASRLVGFRAATPPDRGAALFEGDAAVGEVTRAATSPTLETSVGFGLVDAGATPETVQRAGERESVDPATLPFVEGSDRSARLPTYPD